MRTGKRMRWSMVAVATMIFGVSGWLAAQGPRGHRGPRNDMGPGAFGARMAEQLNLSEDQQNQIKFFLDDQRAQMETLRADGSLTRDQRREQAQQIQEAMRANIQSILSVEQQMQAEQLQRHEAEHLSVERRQHEAEHMLERRQHEAEQLCWNGGSTKQSTCWNGGSTKQSTCWNGFRNGWS